MTIAILFVGSLIAQDWGPAQFLVGNWAGEGGGQAGQGTGAFSFSPELQGKILVRKSFAEYPAANGRPASRHDDLLVLYRDPATRELRATYFDSEEHVIQYTVKSAGGTAVFVSEGAPSGPRYRMSYTSTGKDTLKFKFEIARTGEGLCPVHRGRGTPPALRAGYDVAMLKDRVVLISGAATGIGEAIARLFAGQGAHAFILDCDLAGCRKVADSIASTGGSVQAFGGDVRHPADIAPWVESAIGRFGRIDVLINNAGVYPRQAFLGMSEAQWDEMQEINLKSMFHTLQMVLPHMVAQRSGKVVNISSVTFHLGMALLSHYVASKGGVIGLTRSVAREMGAHNIHVNCITPGAIKTESEAKVLTDEEAQAMVNFQCLQRRMMPLDIARVCLFLSSELSDGMTGQTLNVDGGWVMH